LNHNGYDKQTLDLILPLSHLPVHAGNVESVLNVVLQEPLAAFAQHLGLSEIMTTAVAAAGLEPAALTGSTTAEQLQQTAFMQSIEQAFALLSNKGHNISRAVFKHSLESVVQFPTCTVLAERGQLAGVLQQLERKPTLHFSRSNCDVTWLTQVWLCALPALERGSHFIPVVLPDYCTGCTADPDGSIWQ